MSAWKIPCIFFFSFEQGFQIGFFRFGQKFYNLNVFSCSYMKKSKFWAFFEPAKRLAESARSEKTFSFDRYFNLFKTFNPVVFVLQNDTMWKTWKKSNTCLSFLYSTSFDATIATKDLLSFVTICFCFQFPSSILHKMGSEYLWGLNWI